MRTRLTTIVLLAALLCVLAPAAHADIRIPPAPTRWATDTVGFLSPDTVSELDAELQSFEQQTGHQVLLYIGDTTGGYPIEDFTVKAFEAWKVGRKGLDDGLVLFIMAQDHKIRIEVGYGLEPVVTDLKSSEVINDILAPGIRSGNKDAAVKQAVASLLSTISGKPYGEAPAQQQQRPAPNSPIPSIFIIIIAILFLILLVTHPSLALWLLINILSGGRGGGGGGGGGGGWSGGGGRSGGGGASGGW